jgi:hypothetical protein
MKIWKTSKNLLSAAQKQEDIWEICTKKTFQYKFWRVTFQIFFFRGLSWNIGRERLLPRLRLKITPMFWFLCNTLNCYQISDLFWRFRATLINLEPFAANHLETIILNLIVYRAYSYFEHNSGGVRGHYCVGPPRLTHFNVIIVYVYTIKAFHLVGFQIREFNQNSKIFHHWSPSRPFIEIIFKPEAMLI